MQSSGPDPQYQQALALLNSGQWKGAAEAFHRLNSVRGNDPNCLAGEAMALSNAGGQSNKRFQQEAIRLTRMALQLAPSRADLHQNLGVVLEKYGDYAGAAAAYAESVRLKPDNFNALMMLATVRELLHDVAGARDAVERALRVRPEAGGAAVMAIQLAVREGDGDLVAQRESLEQILARDDIASDTRAGGEYVLGQILGKLGEHELGFDAYARSNVAMREAYPTAPEQREGYLKKLKMMRADLTAERLARWGAERYDDGLPSPALLVGFPRSGTTMTERILDAHEGVHTTEERPYFDQCTREMARLKGDGATSEVAVLDSLTREEVLHLRKVYWQAVTMEHGEVWREKLLLDKLPLRIVRMGTVNRLFPDAKVLVALRDPRDVCLSCFVQRFSVNVGMSFFQDLEETARLYDAVMGMWLAIREKVTVPFKEIRYEETVEDFEGSARSMLEFLGLPWQEDVLEFYKKQRSTGVATPSYIAVTKPVNKGAMGRWRKVESRLAPILPVLEPYVQAFGYGEQS